MKPKKQLDISSLKTFQPRTVVHSAGWYEFIESGDNEKAARLLSMGYLIYSIANAYTEEGIDLIAKHHLSIGKTKTLANNLRQSFDTFDAHMQKLISDFEAKMDVCADFDVVKDILDKFMNAPAGEVPVFTTYQKNDEQ